MNLIESIQQGESKTLELKSQRPQHDQIAKTEVAFAIKSACKAQGLVEPRIREKGDFVDVEFYRPRPDTAAKVPDSAGYNPILPDHVSPQAGRILAHMHQHGSISAAQAAALLNVKVRRARTVLAELINQGLLEKRGSARQTIYVRAKTD